MVRLRNKPVSSQAEAPSSTSAPMAGPLAAGPSGSGNAPRRNAGIGFTMEAGWGSQPPIAQQASQVGPAAPSTSAPMAGPLAAGPSGSGNAPRRNAGMGFTMAGGWGSQPPVAQQASQAGAAAPSTSAPMAGPLAAGPSGSGNAPRRNAGMGFTMEAGWGSQPPVAQQASQVGPAAPSTSAPMAGPLAAGAPSSGNAPRRNAGTSFTMAPGSGWNSQPQVAQQALPPFQPPNTATPPQAGTPSTPAAPRPAHKTLPASSLSAPPPLVFPPPSVPPPMGFPPSAAPPSKGFPPPAAPPSLFPTPPAAPLPMHYQPQTSQTQSPTQWAPYNGPTASQVTYEASKYTVANFVQFSINYPGGFQCLVGLWFRETECLPNTIGNVQGRYGPLGQEWRHDWRNMDLLDHEPGLAREVWKEKDADESLKNTAREIGADPRILAVFHEAIRSWAQDRANDTLVRETLTKANLTQEMLSKNNDHKIIGDIFRMEDCEEKRRQLQEAKSVRPRFYQACLDDYLYCGCRKIVLRYDNSNYTYDHIQHRKPGSLEYQDLPPPCPLPDNFNMDEEGIGRPTQVHGVPPEERAFDSQGNQLLWGLEWHSDHPNARGQKRHVEETGPFGKSNRRRGSSRTRTTTPAKKENPTLDGFQKAWDQELQSQQESSNLRLQNETPQHPVSANKTPTQVIIFGYGFDMQWAALDIYERHSGGMICEDYARDPPSGAKRYPSTFSAPHTRRARTKAERALAARYDGGNYWVKVTFDSAEAAAHATATSPARIYGHWVYAQPYHGHGPEKDEPIPVKAGEQEPGGPTYQPPPRSQRINAQQQQGSSPFSRSFAPSSEDTQHQSHDTSPSSTTATSATATGIDYPDLRQRRASQAETPNTGDDPNHNPEMMRHFPDIPRTKLHPASEAFLPQPSWWERQLKTLSDYGLIPGDIIGHVMPVKEDGTLDSDKASFYWRFFYWIDSHFGTEICGGKDD